jgi:hypothetical protein
MVVDSLTDAQVTQFITQSSWKFAKSMPQMPHE